MWNLKACSQQTCTCQIIAPQPDHTPWQLPDQCQSTGRTLAATCHRSSLTPQPVCEPSCEILKRRVIERTIDVDADALGSRGSRVLRRRALQSASAWRWPPPGRRFLSRLRRKRAARLLLLRSLLPQPRQGSTPWRRPTPRDSRKSNPEANEQPAKPRQNPGRPKPRAGTILRSPDGLEDPDRNPTPRTHDSVPMG